MAMVASSSSSMGTNFQKLYDVFLSFRGEDTRYGITSHIYTALSEKKIETYIDEKSLERGDELSPALLAAIERSKIAVIVLSENYANSSWCLSELVHIHKCRRDRGQFVLPVFYKVVPSNVRKQDEGSYKDAFVEHENNPKHKPETIQEWRDALKASSDLAGSHYSPSNRSESALVKEVVEVVMKELGRPVVSDDDFKGLIGMKSHFTKHESLLSNGLPKLQILGIWGMPGIGKTTIADAVFSRIFSRFESYYFLRNVREGSEKHGLHRLRDELIAKLLRDENVNFGVLSNPIPEHAKDRLRRTKVLLVLDDVSEKKQLEHLVGDHFGDNGSRIIVTTRDEGVLRGTNIEADFEKHKVELLSFDQSLWLFHFTTFRENSVPPEYEELSPKVVEHMGGNPLAITVFGSHLRSLRNPSKENWEMELEKLKEFSHDDIQKVLRISYDGLDKIERKIFLDIACFFKGMHRGFVENILNGCNFFASTGLDDLIDKSLIAIDSEYNKLRMHDLLQQMGWQIVREESEEPSNRSRLWIAEDASCVLNDDTGTSRIEGIFLDTSKLDEDVYLKPAVFQRMVNLRLLKIYEEKDFSLLKHKVYVEEIKCFPRSLRYLEWQRYPLKSLPSQFDPRNLVELKMPFSQLEELWHENGIQNLNKLKGVNLMGSINLTQILDLCHAPNLETLNLKNCSNLLQFPWHALQNLNKLLDLNLGDCHKIRNFPDRIDARVLKALNLSGCLNLKTVPGFVTQSLVFLDLGSTNIVNVPSSIGCMRSLKKLSFVRCRLLLKLPSSITQLNRLEDLSLDGCSSLETFPELPINIKRFSLSWAAIKEVSALCFSRCSGLEDLSIVECRKLHSLPSTMFELPALENIQLEGCSNLKNLPEISNQVKSNLKQLNLCESGIRYLPLSIGNLTNVELLKMNNCANLEFVGNLSILSMSSLTDLEMRDNKNVRRISQLPLSLQYLDATGCTSLVTVSDSTLNTFRSRFWCNPCELKLDTFDYSLYSECLKLEQGTLNNILAEFQLKALHMATHYEAPEFEVSTSPAITTCYPGGSVPDWFNYHSNDSITVTLPPDWPLHDFFGVALCVVVAGRTCNKCSDIDCQITYEQEGIDYRFLDYSSPFTGTKESHTFPVSDSDQVVIWYKYMDENFCGSAKELRFDFSVQERDNKPSTGKIIKCGVHMLCRNDLVELDLIDPRVLRPAQLELDQAQNSTAEPPETSRAITEIVEPNIDSFWNKLCLALTSLLLVCT